MTLAALYGVPWLAILLSMVVAQVLFVPKPVEMSTGAELLRMVAFALNALVTGCWI